MLVDLFRYNIVVVEIRGRLAGVADSWVKHVTCYLHPTGVVVLFLCGRPKFSLLWACTQSSEKQYNGIGMLDS
jgi:hypothetical protein